MRFFKNFVKKVSYYGNYQFYFLLWVIKILKVKLFDKILNLVSKDLSLLYAEPFQEPDGSYSLKFLNKKLNMRHSMLELRTQQQLCF